MEYLFLRRKKTSSTSVRQKTLLYRAAGREWTARFSSLSDVRPADSLIYKGILYQLEIRRAFLDSSLSLKKLSMMLETNQTSHIFPIASRQKYPLFVLHGTDSVPVYRL